MDSQQLQITTLNISQIVQQAEDFFSTLTQDVGYLDCDFQNGSKSRSWLCPGQLQHRTSRPKIPVNKYLQFAVGQILLGPTLQQILSLPLFPHSHYHHEVRALLNRTSPDWVRRVPSHESQYLGRPGLRTSPHIVHSVRITEEHRVPGGRSKLQILRERDFANGGRILMWLRWMNRMGVCREGSRGQT